MLRSHFLLAVTSSRKDSYTMLLVDPQPLSRITYKLLSNKSLVLQNIIVYNVCVNVCVQDAPSSAF